ncbi:FAD binding domain-containing protein [Aquibium oceanicum]|uniref:Xanthine dehydrogenase n=1 Tax=Aquibium oceanicum TaxID=1670800 RepID=A0A1L3SYX9_9HYPH|nr:xanthine dehydrogenase family protein subunit M [Aquibium oceanicum]APH74633.1 xanthine dehydrogenase [Aquibium oceanicum]
MARYARPASSDEALALLSEGEWRVLAGGTDFYPAQGARPITEDVLDINGIDALRGIRETDGHIVIGARTTWTDVLRHDLPPAFDALKMAAREVGSVQIQNAGTVAGNLCNASPAADGVPALMILDAEVELSSKGGVRDLALADFVLGNRRTARRPDELLTAIRIPKTSTTGTSHFLKLGARRYLVISIAMVAVRIDLAGDGSIGSAAVAVGACSPVARRLGGLEQVLAGAAPDEIAGRVEARHFEELTPIDDVRGSAGYRKEAARELVLRALFEALGTPRIREVAA